MSTSPDCVNRSPSSAIPSAGADRTLVVIIHDALELRTIGSFDAWRRLQGPSPLNERPSWRFGAPRHQDDARPESAPDEGAPPANPHHDGKNDKTPADHADEGPVKRKAQADEPGPYEAPARRLELRTL